MKNAKIYVGNLKPEATAEELSALFGRFAEVRSVTFLEDVFEGFALLELAEGPQAAKAVESLHGHSLHGLTLSVSWAQEAPAAPGAAPRKNGTHRLRTPLRSVHA